MDAEDSVNDWSSDDENQVFNDSSLNIDPPRGSRLPQQSQRRPARKTLPFVPYADWFPDQSYGELPLSCIHHIMEWKLTINGRLVAKQTEDNPVVAPSDFWNEELSSKIADIVKSTARYYKAIRKLEIDWPIVEGQLQAWSHLLCIGKKLRINVSFNCIESSKAARTAGRELPLLGSPRETRLDAEQVVSSGPDA